MSLIAKGKETSGDTDEAGLYQGVCYAIYDLGTQENKKFNGQDRKVLFLFEIPELTYEIEEDGEKKTIRKTKSIDFTNSLHRKANMRPFLENWRGKKFTSDELKGFDLKKVLGVNGYLNLVREKEYLNIGSISPLKKTDIKIEPEHALVCFDLDEGGKAPESAPQWIQDKINNSLEMQGEFDEFDKSDESGKTDDETPPVDSYEDDQIPF